MPVSERYQIQEIVAQDESGVVFRATDRESGRTVALSRFFPFGRDGGGLEVEECEEYRRGVAEVSDLKLPALRAVLDGGWDPVDGVPYLVTEWLEGELLSDMLAYGEFEADAVAAVLDRALELCERISRALGTEALWVETAPVMIVLAGDDRERGFTFGLSPVRWLVETRDRRSLLPLVALAEELMGWQGRWVSERAGGGLGGFLKWLRGNAENTSLRETRVQLARWMRREIPAPDRQPEAELAAAPPPYPQRATQPAPTAALDAAAHPPGNGATSRATSQQAESRHLLQMPNRSRRNPWRWVAVLVVAVGVAGWWVVKHPPRGGGRPAAPATAEAPPPTASTVFKVEDRLAVLNEEGKRITVEGVLEHVKPSESGKTLYLEFAGCGTDGTRGRVVVKDSGPDLAEPALRKWLGKRVRTTGVVAKRYDRPEISLADGKAIQQAP